jgi:hypothetical protein
MSDFSTKVSNEIQYSNLNLHLESTLKMSTKLTKKSKFKTYVEFSTYNFQWNSNINQSI